jgi:hypothetical protein
MRATRFLIASAGWLILGAACGKSPSQPSPQPTQGQTPQAPSITSLQVNGPTRVSPGATVQYSATAKYYDGSSKEVTETTVANDSRRDARAAVAQKEPTARGGSDILHSARTALARISGRRGGHRRTRWNPGLANWHPPARTVEPTPDRIYDCRATEHEPGSRTRHDSGGTRRAQDRVCGRLRRGPEASLVAVAGLDRCARAARNGGGSWSVLVT